MKKKMFYRYFFFSFITYNLVKGILLSIYHREENLTMLVATTIICGALFTKNEIDIRKTK